MKIISDSRIRSIIAKGPNYRFHVPMIFKSVVKKLQPLLMNFVVVGVKERMIVDCDDLKDWKLNIFLLF